ncbi:MAG: SpoIID/LytB domain-containing protein [Planctomycetes bacterium]|nr:SpoIID/LytB domain-containing protein [Planctomycetota bacterium]
MTHRSNRHSGEGGKSLGVWLALTALMICAAFVFKVDSRNDTPPMQVKSPLPTRPVKKVKSVESPPVDLSVSPLIRVNVTPGGSDSLNLEIRGPYSIRLVGSSKELSKGTELKTVKVQSTATGLKLGKSTFSTTRLEIVPGKSPAVRINDHLYRGTVRLFRRTDGQVSAVNVLPLEEYLASVVDSEMPAAFPPAARQAQAIVSRTYALYQMAHADPAAVFDLYSSQRSQKYLGVEYTDSGRRLAGESESSRKAVADTRGVVCAHRGQLFSTYYSATCGGQTTTGTEIFPDAAPVIKSVPCDWCRDSEYFRWTAQVERRDFLKKTQPTGSLSTLTSIQQTAGPGGGVISRFRLTDGKKSADVTGVQLRDQLALRSPHFTLTMQKDQIHAAGRGHGHGVGLCQWGARGQAQAGKTAYEIVRHYYPGAELVVIDY